MDSLLGITHQDWKDLLSEPGNRIDQAYRARKMHLNILTIINSYLKKKDDRKYGKLVASAEIKEPIFILGHWRSGTTLLHTLLSLDQQFSFPNKFQISHPHSFLLREKKVEKIFQQAQTQKRHMDNVEITFKSPDEDETAIAMMSLRSPVIAWAFTRNEKHYARFHTFLNSHPDDLMRWKSAMIQFYKRLTFRSQRPLILKSPIHLGRMRIFYEQFPDARFIHIYRNPYRIFQSTKKLYATALPHTCLQKPDLIEWEDSILTNYNDMYHAFWIDREKLPKDRLIEIAYEDFERDIYHHVARIYEYFHLPNFSNFEPKLKNHLALIKNYQKNTFKPLSSREIAKINQFWHQNFEILKYDMQSPMKYESLKSGIF